MLLGDVAVTPLVGGVGFERVPLRMLRATAGVRAFHVPTAALQKAELCQLCAAGVVHGSEACRRFGCEGGAQAG